MKIQENISLAQYTTFKIGGPARYFCVVKSSDDLIKAVEFTQDHQLSILVLGGGSNVLIADSGFGGLVIKMELEGIEFADYLSDKNKIFVSAQAGENFDDFIEKVVRKGYYGLENLSGIPGTVGALPVQNVSAYGQEISSLIESVRVLDLLTMKFIDLKKTECQFGYRESIFKKDKNHYIIVSVTFSLQINGRVNIDYRDLKEYFSARNIVQPSLKDVRQAVIEIRRQKLPDWKSCGTAGSFFKNPIIPLEQWKELEKKYPDMPHFLEPDGRVKIALGWVLDKLCQAKGLTKGNVGTYQNQALVVVSKPGATATEVVDFTQELIKKVNDKTGLQIEGEVSWVC